MTVLIILLNEEKWLYVLMSIKQPLARQLFDITSLLACIIAVFVTLWQIYWWAVEILENKGENTGEEE